jgi:hypothetical protein
MTIQEDNFSLLLTREIASVTSIESCESQAILFHLTNFDSRPRGVEAQHAASEITLDFPFGITGSISSFRRSRVSIQNDYVVTLLPLKLHYGLYQCAIIILALPDHARGESPERS